MKKNNDIENKLIDEVKIISLEGSSILKNNIKDEIINKIYNINFNKSLLLNKLINVGLEVSRINTSRDIINVRFSYGYDKDTEKIETLEKEIEEKKAEKDKSKAGDSEFADVRGKTKIIKARREERKKISVEIEEKKKELDELKMTKDLVREQLYQEGFFLDFYKVKKDKNKNIVKVEEKDKEGKIILDENNKPKMKKTYELDKKIKYVYWFRTSAKARVGEVFFINKKLLDKINDWQQMGIEFVEDEECKLVEMEAYKALTASSLESLIKINPRTEILVINDLESFSNHNCKLVKTDNDKNCFVENNNIYQLKNTLFDGQSLVDSSLFVGDLQGQGMALLRQHMFKSCAFNAKIQLFFKEYCTNNNVDYNTFTIKDRYNRKLLAKNIKLITTENSMKWEKFDVSMEDWINAVENDNNYFGIVKTEHTSKYNNLQRMSYQQLNTLDPKVNLDNVLNDTLEYTENIKNNTAGYIEYLETTKNEMNINEMLIDLYIKNNDIKGTKFFKDYKKYKIRDWKDRLKSGKVLINGDNLTIIANPYLMLLHSVKKVPNTNNIVDSQYIDVSLGEGNVCYTARFTENEELACFRNPHNSPNNIYSVKNTKTEIMDKYFNFTDNIIAANLINTDWQDRLNGADQDSDFVLTTNQDDIVNFAKECKDTYPTIVNCIDQDKRQYKNNMESMSRIDNALAKSKNDIGVTSNMAQITLSWYFNSKKEELYDVVCICSVLAQVAIDNAKRKYAVNLEQQINRIRNMECLKKYGKKKPSFWEYTDENYDKEKDEDKLIKVNCTMCNLTEYVNRIKKSIGVPSVKIIKLLDKTISNNYKLEQLQSYLDRYKEYKNTDKFLINKIKKTENKEYKAKYVDQQKDNTMKINEFVSKLKINKQNIKALIKSFDDRKNKELELETDFLNFVYKNNKELFLSVFMEDGKGVKSKMECHVA